MVPVYRTTWRVKTLVAGHSYGPTDGNTANTAAYFPSLTSSRHMSRIPPSLLYLTIYNPTLKPTLLDPDNEDAEEQAHILFYTAREHAVSRDKILRQVGLAKALVNFSE